MYYYIANWKMYQSLQGITQFVEQLSQDTTSTFNGYNARLKIAASYEQIDFLRRSLLGVSSVCYGAQDCSQYNKGPYTGQVSVESLADLGIDFCIIGHSEARIYLGQSSELIALKMKALLAMEISPVICIGETLQEYQNGETIERLYDQLSPIFTYLKEYTGNVKIYIAYEPIYAIGSGIVAKIEDLENIFNLLHLMIQQLSVAKNITFLYGGSVSSSSISCLKKIQGISGFLIGKMSIDFQELKKIVDLS